MLLFQTTYIMKFSILIIIFLSLFSLNSCKEETKWGKIRHESKEHAEDAKEKSSEVKKDVGEENKNSKKRIKNLFKK